jgi:hypothetical protein
MLKAFFAVVSFCFLSSSTYAQVSKSDTAITYYGDVKITVYSEKGNKAPANEIDALKNVKVENPDGLSVELHDLISTTLSSIYNSNVKNTGKWKGMRATKVQISKRTSEKESAGHQYPDENFNK